MRSLLHHNTIYDIIATRNKVINSSGALTTEVDVVTGLIRALGQRLRPHAGEDRVISDDTHDPDDPTVVARKYSCIGGSGGNVHGNCAESWWDHIWNDRPYCSDRKFWCEWGGGVFTKE